jgi:predicted lipase
LLAPPGISSLSKHDDFRTAPTILAAVQALLTHHCKSSVVLTGHSLGMALVLPDSVYLSLHLPPGTCVRMIGYGISRVGNRAFADYVDALRHDNIGQLHYTK